MGSSRCPEFTSRVVTASSLMVQMSHWRVVPQVVSRVCNSAPGEAVQKGPLSGQERSKGVSRCWREGRPGGCPCALRVRTTAFPSPPRVRQRGAVRRGSHCRYSGRPAFVGDQCQLHTHGDRRGRVHSLHSHSERHRLGNAGNPNRHRQLHQQRRRDLQQLELHARRQRQLGQLLGELHVDGPWGERDHRHLRRRWDARR